MAIRGEEFDEFCDPKNPKIVKYDDVLKAKENLKKHNILPTACIERGALNALELLSRDKKKIGVCVASLGNQAMGICYYGQKMQIPVFVVLPTIVPISNIEKCHSFGAQVVVEGDTYREAQVYAKKMAREKGLTFINGRDHPDVLAGYGTVALEILDQVPGVDAVMVPVGSGGLVAAVAAVIKYRKPDCLVYGVQPKVIPTFFKSLKAGERVTLPWRNSLADGIAMSYVGVNSFETAYPLLDKMLLVEEDWIARAILHLVEKEHYIIEGAGACPLAAIMANLVPELKLKTVVCIATGGNIDTSLMSRCLDRGRAAEGRLVKFKVGIKDTPRAYEKLLRMLADGQFNLYNIIPDWIWVENEIYTVEVKVVCETKGLKHAFELKRMIEKAYPCTASFEAEPFSERRTCPCFIKSNF